MKRSLRTGLILGAAVIAIALCCLLFIKSPESSVVAIIQDGRELYRLDLAREEDRTIQVEYNGRVNIIEIKEHRIRVAEADCPDNTCVKTGWLEQAPIICLPNRLVIQYAD